MKWENILHNEPISYWYYKNGNILVNETSPIMILWNRNNLINDNFLRRLHGERQLSCSLQYLFTYSNLSSIFNILHPSNTPIMQTLQNFYSDPNSYIHTTHIINAFFVKMDNVAVVSWLQYITSVILDVILHNKPFHRYTLWITRNHLPTLLKYFCLRIISHTLPPVELHYFWWKNVIYNVFTTEKCLYWPQKMVQNSPLLMKCSVINIKNWI